MRRIPGAVIATACAVFLGQTRRLRPFVSGPALKKFCETPAQVQRSAEDVSTGVGLSVTTWTLRLLRLRYLPSCFSKSAFCFKEV